jgi:hypothetical protein
VEGVELCGRDKVRYKNRGGVPKWLRERSAKPPFTGSNPVAAFRAISASKLVEKFVVLPRIPVILVIVQFPIISRSSAAA